MLTDIEHLIRAYMAETNEFLNIGGDVYAIITVGDEDEQRELFFTNSGGEEPEEFLSPGEYAMIWRDTGSMGWYTAEELGMDLATWYEELEAMSYDDDEF